MKIRMSGTNETRAIEMRDYRTGIEITADIICGDDNISYDNDNSVYTCDYDTYEYWHNWIDRHNTAETAHYDYLDTLPAEHRYDAGNAILDSIGDVEHCDYPQAWLDAVAGAKSNIINN